MALSVCDFTDTAYVLMVNQTVLSLFAGDQLGAVKDSPLPTLILVKPPEYDTEQTNSVECPLW